MIKFTKVRPVKSPTRGTEKSTGIDFYIPDNFLETANDSYVDHRQKCYIILPGMDVNIPTGIHVKLPKNTSLIMFNKSGMATKKGLIVGACVIDEDYQGEPHIHLINTGRSPVSIYPGEKAIQGILMPADYSQLEEVANIDVLYEGVETERGADGFGSTDQK